jgi:hypothetical protein
MAQQPLNPTIPMTRKGKIARLPRHVRDELNHRLDDGESSTHLVIWLNSLEEVQPWPPSLSGR